MNLRIVTIYVEAVVALALIGIVATGGDIWIHRINWEAIVAITTLFLGFTTIYVGRIALRVDKNQAWREDDRRIVAALCLSVPLYHELRGARNTFNKIVTDISKSPRDMNAGDLLRGVLAALNGVHVAVLERLVEQFSIFGFQTGGKLALALDRILMARPTFELGRLPHQIDLDLVEETLNVRLEYGRLVLSSIDDALLAIRPLFEKATRS